uniref:Glycosyl transferase protein, family 1 n=1 Tax=uncultured Flavobacteriia bacterium TaxID=212695 RepID=F4MN30_9BACT|nr:glycosyl transferase protein, family 1 [uncultured Flavobacteriia bacterium]
MTKKKVLIITYYWPPSGGAGVQRWLKFIKYLPNYNWNPTVFTVRNGEYPVLDEVLLKDVPEHINVIKGPIWEPYSFYKKITGRKKYDRINSSFLSQKRKKMVLFEKLSIWIRGNFFIPDARRFWIKPSIRILSKILEQNTFDAIISTGPPHSTHLIASTLAKRFSIPWLADFRDPWTNIDFYKDLMLSHWADRKHSGIPGYRARIRPIVSRITIHWPSFYNVVTGKTLALPNLIALQHIPLSPAGVIAKRPAPIALPNSCAAEWRMAPDAVFSPYASVRYFTPHMVHSQYNLL